MRYRETVLFGSWRARAALGFALFGCLFAVARCRPDPPVVPTGPTIPPIADVEADAGQTDTSEGAAEPAPTPETPTTGAPP